jgi:UDP-N-acetylmuramoyl-tripeptide--D-alanyl-D-alanine ligase
VIILEFISHIIFTLALGYYLITNLQWYSYKLDRVIFHHTKIWWHFAYFLVPFSLYLIAGKFGFIIAIGYLVLLWKWYNGLDKPLVFTGRVKRFFIALIFLSIFSNILCLVKFECASFATIIPLFFAIIISNGFEAILFNGFKQQAIKKLKSHKDMIIIGVTASYGKTSIKNFLAHILSRKYKVYATPRSVNTLGGILKDINSNLPNDTEIYIVEMGARGKGDILEITELLNPQYAIVGKIGSAHIEYFGNLENIRDTKMEIISSKRLIKAWVHSSANINPNDNIIKFGDDIKDIKAGLDGISFVVDDTYYQANILGGFNSMNLTVSIKVAQELGIDKADIKLSLVTLKPVENRLQRIDAGGKIILDDSFNGNIDGMLDSFALANTYNGRKVLITPGLVEVDDIYNKQVALRANEVFDLIIVSGELNYKIFKDIIDSDKLLKLKSKDKMQEMLIEHTKSGDLILFANDAPSFI